MLLAALVIPGGLIALFGALALTAMRRSERGRHVLALAQKRVPAWASSWTFDGMQQRQAA